MAANIATVADAIAAYITSGLDAPTDATVTRCYLAPVNYGEISGRKIYVFPVNYNNGPATRGENEWVYSIQVTTIERYETAGEPDTAWVDTRVEFVQEKVFDRLGFDRTLLVFGTTRELVTQSQEVNVYDESALSQHKVFRSDVVFEFRETLTA
jgi:hypothetical protein